MTTNATRPLGRLSGLESTAPSAPGRNRTCDTRFRKRRVEFCAAVERICPEAVARPHVSPSRPRFAPCTCNGCTGLLAGEDGKPLSAGTVLNTHLVLTRALGHGWRTAPCQSRPTAGSSPTTQPSDPGRITKASPGVEVQLCAVVHHDVLSARSPGGAHADEFVISGRVAIGRVRRRRYRGPGQVPRRADRASHKRTAML